jgi:hypothetical protein
MTKILLGLAAVGAVVGLTTAAVATADSIFSRSTHADAKRRWLLTTGAVDVSATLAPGVVGDARIRVFNRSPHRIRVTDVAGNGAVTSDKGPACDASTGVTFTDQHGLALEVPGKTWASFTLPGAVSMDHTSDGSCASATFTIPVAATGCSPPVTARSRDRC